MSRSLSFELPAVKVPSKVPAVGTIKNILHMLQVLTTFLTICIVASVIATEIRFYDGSQPGPNWALVVGIFSIAVPLGLVLFPWLYEKKGKFKRIGKFTLKPRTNLIFTGFYTVLWATAGIAMSVHAANPAHCNLDEELIEVEGYASAWSSQCTCANVVAGFAWTTCVLWLLSLFCTLIIFWKEKQLIQKNLKQHELNKHAVLQMQQQEQDDYDDERASYHRPTGGGRYYEDEEGEDLGNMRPSSFEQARPLRAAATPSYGRHSPVPVAVSPSPFDSPFDSPYDPHTPRHSGQQDHNYQAAEYQTQQHTVYEDYSRYSPEPQSAYPVSPAPMHPAPQATMEMPVPIHFSGQQAQTPKPAYDQKVEL